MNDQGAMVNRAAKLYETEHVSEAVVLCNKVLSTNSRDLNALRLLSLCQTKLANYDDAAKLFKRVRKLAPKNPTIFTEEAVLHRALGQYGQMISCCREALKLDPKNKAAEEMLADALERSGELDKAQDFIESVIKRRGFDPNVGEKYALVKELQGSLEQAVVILDKSLGMDIHAPVRRRMLLHRGRVLEKLGRYEEAFDSFKSGNSVLKSTYDPNQTERNFEAFASSFEPWPECADDSSLASSELLIFVVGMPRSGTSLIERILGSHSQVHGAGEFQILNRTLMQYQDTLPHPAKISIATAESSDLEKIRKDVLDQFKSLTGRRERIVSKNLTNGRNLGVIGRLFPKARIIRILRDPVDVGLSIWGSTLPLDSMPWSGNLNSIGHFMRSHNRLVDRFKEVVPNPWLDVDYASLVAKPDVHIRELIDFSGLDWEEGCLRPEKSESDRRGGRFEPTLSYQQVRKPINADSLGRAEGYGTLLDPLRNALES